MEKELSIEKPDELNKVTEILGFLAEHNIFGVEQLEELLEPTFFAIIPLEILEDINLSANSKLLYAEICALSRRSGKCFATNEYIAKRLGLSKRTIPTLLKELKERELISVHIKAHSGGTFRDIRVSFNNDGGGRQRARGGIAKERGHNRNRQREIDNKINTSDSVAKVMKVFEQVNPSIKRMYGNITQRKSADNLISRFGVDNVLKAAQVAVNLLEVKYSPKITTPYQLETKWAELVAFVKQNKPRNQVIL